MDISPAALREDLSKADNVHLIDVREELEYYTFNIGGTNIPMSGLAEVINHLSFHKSDHLVVVCQHGIRSETTRKMFALAGYVKVKNLKGGLLAYRKLFMR